MFYIQQNTYSYPHKLKHNQDSYGQIITVCHIYLESDQSNYKSFQILKMKIGGGLKLVFEGRQIILYLYLSVSIIKITLNL